MAGRPKYAIPHQKISLYMAVPYIDYLKKLAERKHRNMGQQVQALLEEYARHNGDLSKLRTAEED